MNKSDTALPSARHYLEQMKSGSLSSEELVSTTLERINRVNDKLNAVVDSNDERSIELARQADQKRAKGEELPLLGLPITIKDSIDVEGFNCTGGSFARENYKPQDSTCAARLREAGAILIAKTNCPEYSSGVLDRCLVAGSFRSESPCGVPLPGTCGYSGEPNPPERSTAARKGAAWGYPGNIGCIKKPSAHDD